MLTGTYPGIYLLEAESGVRTIVGVPTAIAAFVGPTLTGIDNRARQILNFGDFERSFGGLTPDSELSYGILHFFQNGGGEAVVVRAPRDGAVAAAINANNAGGAMLTLTALGSGAAGGNLYAEIESLPASKAFSLSITDANTGVRELFGDLSTEASSQRFAPSVVNDPDLGSQLLSVAFKTNGDPAPLPTGTTFKSTPVNGVFGTKATRDYSFRASISRFDGANKIDHLAEVDIPLFAANDVLPGSLLAFGKSIEGALNNQLAAKAPKLGVEATVLEFRDSNNNVTGRQLRFRIKSSDPVNDVSPDAVIELKPGDKPPQGIANPDKPVFALFGLTDALANASRYRLGFNYGADARIKTTAQVAGVDGGAYPTAIQIKTALGALDKVVFNLLCLPDAVRAKLNDPLAPFYDYQDIYTSAAALCEKRYAFLLLDPPPNVTDVNKAEAWKSNELTIRTKHGATYFPRLKMSDPINPTMLRAYPPSGAMAGVMARTDANRGVWKSPAGVDATIAGVFAPAVELSDEEHGLLNPIGINCFRKFPIYGSVAFGARTLVGSDEEASPWKYLAVRRTASYILLSLQRGLKWVTFEPNDEPLWGQIRMNVTTFMQGLFRQGAFQGKSPRDAYLVKCDSETTLQSDINQGIVNVVVGFAPLKPAEFVFITLRQLAGQAQS